MAASAAHAYDVEASKSADLRLRRLNGIMLTNTTRGFGPKSDEVEFCTTSRAAVRLSYTLVHALDCIRLVGE
jgi:hypothetical protein